MRAVEADDGATWAGRKSCSRVCVVPTGQPSKRGKHSHATLNRQVQVTVCSCGCCLAPALYRLQVRQRQRQQQQQHLQLQLRLHPMQGPGEPPMDLVQALSFSLSWPNPSRSKAASPSIASTTPTGTALVHWLQPLSPEPTNGLALAVRFGRSTTASSMAAWAACDCPRAANSLPESYDTPAESWPVVAKGVLPCSHPSQNIVGYAPSWQKDKNCGFSGFHC